MIKGAERVKRIVNLMRYIKDVSPEDASEYRLTTAAGLFIGEWKDTDWTNEAICIEAKGRAHYILAEHILAVALEAGK